MDRPMRSGELKQLVLTLIQEKGPLNVREVLNEIKLQTNNDYAYTTIATIIRRLENNNLIDSSEDKIYGRQVKTFVLKKNAPENEVRHMLNSLVGRFGMMGVKHLSKVFDSRLTDEELEELKKEFEILEEHD